MVKGTPSGKILLIEDDAIQLDILVTRLSRHGYDVITATDGEEGIALARSGRPQLIVCDVMMPVKNGFQVCKDLRREGINIPFIFLTAKGMSEDQTHGLQLGADDYIVKPYDPAILEAKIATFLRRSQANP